MDQETLVNRFRDVVVRIEKEDGPVILLLLESLDVGVSNVWNVIVSSPAFDKEPRSAVRKVLHYVRKSLDKASWPMIGRVTVLRTDDPFVIAMIQRLPQSAAGTMLQRINVSGIDISEALVVEAKRLAA